MARPSIHSRRPDERGAVLVEAAIILPLILVLLFGIIEYGFAFKDSLTVSSASRAVARTVAAMPRDPDYKDAAVDSAGSALTALPQGSPEFLTIYKAAPNSDQPVDGTFTTCATCVRYSWTGSAWQLDHDGWSSVSQNACGGQADTLGVWIQAHHDFITGFFGAGRTLRDNTVMRLEPIPATQQCR